MSATTEENLKVVCPNGKIVKWTGKQITYGEWPEALDDAGYTITVYETPRGSLVALLYDAAESREDVVVAPSQALLIGALRDHESAPNDDFMAALQNALPEEEIWTEVIE
jgi:hypothetical protein